MVDIQILEPVIRICFTSFLHTGGTLILFIAATMALALLFVYKPKKFKSLPYIVLAVMGVLFAFYVSRGMVFSDYVPYLSKNDVEVFVQYVPYHIICAVPIVVLCVLLIVQSIQKKKQKKLKYNG